MEWVAGWCDEIAQILSRVIRLSWVTWLRSFFLSFLSPKNLKSSRNWCFHPHAGSHASTHSLFSIWFHAVAVNSHLTCLSVSFPLAHRWKLFLLPSDRLISKVFFSLAFRKLYDIRHQVRVWRNKWRWLAALTFLFSHSLSRQNTDWCRAEALPRSFALEESKWKSCWSFKRQPIYSAIKKRKRISSTNQRGA